MQAEQSIEFSEQLAEAIQSQNCLILSHNGYHTGFPNIIASSNAPLLPVHSFDTLQQAHQSSNKTIVGCLAYDAKNETAALKSDNIDFFEWPHYMFFKSDEIHTFDTELLHQAAHSKDVNEIDRSKISQLVSKEEYISNVNSIRNYIREGEVYEINYCIPFTVSDIEIDPFKTYLALNAISPMPYSGYFKAGHRHIISASPESYLNYTSGTLTSKPMKGTKKRDKNNSTRDQLLKKELEESIKERAENLMIVDLVRHDFKKSCKTGSIKVNQLFEVDPFPLVHQMTSTVVGTPKEDVSAIDMIKNCFPMGSMTGAPKIRAMEVIEEMEIHKRGMFSGTMGYIEPNGSFDLNVLIRSIFYDSKQKKLSFQVGSAITYDSSPEHEYEECMLKAEAIFSAVFKQ